MVISTNDKEQREEVDALFFRTEQALGKAKMSLDVA